MTYISRAKALTVNEVTWWVNARKSGLYTKMAKQIINQIEVMLNKHSKVHLVRFDLHQTEFTDDNSHISAFNRRLFRRIKVKYNTSDIGFIWSRELDKSDSQHYHYTLMLDGHKIRHPEKLLKIIRDVWEHMEGFRYIPKNCYYNLHRDDHDSIQRAVYRVSYLAKARGKKKRPKQTKDYATSRLKWLISTAN